MHNIKIIIVDNTILYKITEISIIKDNINNIYIIAQSIHKKIIKIAL